MFKKIKSLFTSNKIENKPLPDVDEKKDEVTEINNEVIASKQIKSSDFLYLMNYTEIDNKLGISKENTPFTVSKNLIKEGMFVLKGEKIIQYDIDNTSSNTLKKVLWEVADETGLVLYITNQGAVVKEGQLVYSIRPSNVNTDDIKNRLNSVMLVNNHISYKREKRLVHDFTFNQGMLIQIIESIDDFEGNILETTEFRLLSDDASNSFYLKILQRNSGLYISLQGYRKHFPMKKDDNFIILTESKENIALKFSRKPNRIKKDHDGIIVENEIQISEKILENLFIDSMINWKLVSLDKDLDIKGSTMGRVQQIEFLQKFKFGIKALLLAINK